ncbi:SEL1-like repeat protein [Acinetobacter sp. ANC 4648]|uniref:SEL1-like repeat protein n=1 Tax=Acinetobacter sp. ANC 4648 TaxID=1977875 RepID=UPI000A337E80|nr:SEL1-like repeat protein [Acinetobacter sp. ANC 4648]OTG83841.1 hypothetical protein B9T27_04920 [Acinetobacter sp. ANC 4648]
MIYCIIVVVLSVFLFWLSRTLKKSSAMLNQGLEYAVQHGRIPKEELENLLNTGDFIHWAQEQVSHRAPDEITRVGQAQIFGQLLLEYYHLKNPEFLNQEKDRRSALSPISVQSLDKNGRVMKILPELEVYNHTQLLNFFDVEAERDRILIILHRASTALSDKERVIDELEVLALKYADMKSAEFLGDFYNMGKYVKKDTEVAQLFYEIAAGQGSEIAKQRIQQLKSD